MSKLSAAQQRYLENAVFIAASRLIFSSLVSAGVSQQHLDNIADTTSGGTPSRNVAEYFGGDIPWIKSGDLNDGMIEQVDEFITDDGLRNSSAKIYPAGTLVIALYGATVGKTGILTFDAASNQAVCAIFPKSPEISKDYLYWFLRHKRQDFLDMSFGGAQPNISQKLLRETLIPLPSPALQTAIANFLTLVERRQQGNRVELGCLPTPLDKVPSIVAQIEALSAWIEEARGLRQQAVEETEALYKSSLGIAYDEAALIANATTYRLDELCQQITDGTHARPRYVDSGIPFISIKDISSGVISFDDVKYITPEEHAELTKRCKPEYGDILLTKVGSNNGFAKVIDVDREFSIFVSLALIKPDKSRLIPQFLEYMLNSPRIHDISLESTRGVGYKNLVLKFIKAFPIPVPCLDEQQRIVDHLELLKLKIEHLKQLQNVTEVELTALLPSILDKAFKGELETGQISLADAFGLTERQCILLDILWAASKMDSQPKPEPVQITPLMKYAFLFGKEAAAQPQQWYEFHAYDYGPFSREVYDDLEALVAAGLVTRVKRDVPGGPDYTTPLADQADAIRDQIAALPDDLRQGVRDIIATYGHLKLNDLLRLVYRKYPDYAGQSRRGDLRG